MSTRTTSRATKAVAAGLVFAITQVLLGGGMARAAATSTSSYPAATAKGAAAVSGYLATRGNSPATVDGNAARTGETVFSGQQIQTPEGTGASVYLGGLGRVDMAPGSSLTLSFGDSRVVTRLAAGCAILSPGKGVEGVVETKATAEKTNSSPIDLCVDAVDGVALKGVAAESGAGAQQPPPQDDDRRAGGAPIPGSGGGGMGTGTAIAITAAAVGAFSLIAYHRISGPGCRRGRNFSPTLPRGPGDCP